MSSTGSKRDTAQEACGVDVSHYPAKHFDFHQRQLTRRTVTGSAG